jgi:YfiH family protein
MISQPFPLLRQFRDVLDIQFLTRADNSFSDADIARVSGKSSIVGLKQVHGNRAVLVRESSSRIIEADALATDVPGLTLTIRFADCQNAVLFVPSKKVVALVHAGWRGVQSEIFSSTFTLLHDEWKVEPDDVFVGLGPSLCTACADFTDPAKEVPELSDFFYGQCVDLRAAADRQIEKIGVPKHQIERLSDCPRCSPERYFTYRGGDHDKVKKGYVNSLAVTL